MAIQTSFTPAPAGAAPAAAPAELLVAVAALLLVADCAVLAVAVLAVAAVTVAGLGALATAAPLGAALDVAEPVLVAAAVPQAARPSDATMPARVAISRRRVSGALLGCW